MHHVRAGADVEAMILVPQFRCGRGSVSANESVFFRNLPWTLGKVKPWAIALIAQRTAAWREPHLHVRFSIDRSFRS